MSLDDQSDLVDVVAWAEKRPQTSTDHHLFRRAILYSGGRKLKLHAMIDSGLPYNLISQDIIARVGLPGDDQNIPSAQDLNGGGIRLYRRHHMAVEMMGTDNTATLDAAKIYGANITGCKLILGLPWLRKAEPSIKWLTNVVLFKANAIKPVSQEAAAIRAQTTGVRDVSAALLPDTPQESSNSSPAIACVGIEEMASICHREGLEAYMVEWRDTSVPGSSFAADSLVGAIIGALGGERVEDPVLPAKYADFADVFDKRRADVLPEHSQHDLAIEIEDNQVPPFSLTYDHSRTELEVLREYINNMLTKGFIVPSKSPSGALVLFTKKKDGGLRLCVDFRGLNSITKKNKHPLPLIRTLLDLLAGAKQYTKFDIIAAYSALCICKGDEWKTAFWC